MNKVIYIPTTTLNFNNILSSESLSPKSFYSKRGFGYSRWFSIEENPYDNAIVVYDSFASFKREKSEYEDHPLLIEIIIDDNEFKSFTKVSKGVYLCDHTLYLDPWNTTFIFFSEEEKKITLSMSETSLETKLLSLYKNRILVRKLNGRYLEFKGKDVKCNLKEIDKDVHVNKMKGLIYGYYIGSFFSTSLVNVKKINTLYEIKNIFAAIVSSMDRQPTTIQLERLKFLFSFMLEENDLYKQVFSICKDASQTTEILEVIYKEFSYIKNYEHLNRLLDALRNPSKKDQTNFSINWVNNKICDIKKQMNDKSNLLYPEQSKLVIIKSELSRINSIDNEFDEKLMIYLIKEVFSDTKYNGKISTFKEELSDIITIKAKEYFGGKWENSKAKVFFNNLRRHVRGEGFNYSFSNDVYSIIAAVVISGDDWKKLLRFMQSHEMTEYSLAFSLYGCLNGFANLTRDYTDVLFNNKEEKKYTASVYKEVYGNLFSKKLDYLPLNDKSVLLENYSFGSDDNKQKEVSQTQSQELLFKDDETIKNNSDIVQSINNLFSGSNRKFEIKKPYLAKLQNILKPIANKKLTKAYIAEVINSEFSNIFKVNIEGSKTKKYYLVRLK